MSVLIKGMEMPNSCEECPLCCDEAFGSYKCCRVKGWGDDNSRAYDCPLVEVPTPHGRLIDENELLRHKYGFSQTARVIIKTTDAVIEAEVSE